MGIVIAVISGALMSVQGIFNEKVTEKAGIWTTNTFVQFTAFLVCLIVWFCREKTSFEQLLQIQPRYMLLGGVFGAAITWTVIQSIEKMGPASAVLFIVISQIIVAYGIELLGIFGVEKQPLAWNKVWGGLIAIGGLILFQRK